MTPPLPAPPPGLEIRPLRPSNRRAYLAFAARLDPEDVRLRFGQAVPRLTRGLIDSLLQVDPARTEVLVAVLPEARGPAIVGVARAALWPGTARVDLGLIVRSDLKRRGIGTALAQALAERCQARGWREIEAAVLAENRPMLQLAAKLGAALGGAEAGMILVTARI
jgi:acetyltransferase